MWTNLPLENITHKCCKFILILNHRIIINKNCKNYEYGKNY